MEPKRNKNDMMMKYMGSPRALLYAGVFFAFGVASCHAPGSGGGDAPLDTAALLQKGRERDSLAAARAVNGWWTASMRNHDKRIAWWRQARFGCFMHWGVYSGPGGVWKGKQVHGYAEHLMRIEKIPLAEYRKEVVEKFDPVYFDADRWVRRIKAAGMRYLIITAKHHDGFAMYNSDVSDYNVVKATPWHHDPMKDLAAACRKYGIHFGFYYSQAFDWQDPNAPGNDWDYENPGGDRHLFGGVHWYDLHPAMLKRIEKYVNGKAIPQIKELIAKYHPDILWFDTPSKLPFSENLRILEEIRKVDTNVVIDGRLANWGGMHFGDYQSTSDRPKEFYPVKGDWEAIPTTNESYGYSKMDTVHKPASFFIRLLAKAASRGGNMLMNIGPMGNGRIDPRDTLILHGIGRWMQVNDSSIYGTEATPLPLQAWGVSTRKGNTLYLQVFQWPEDGKLIVGGLESPVATAYILGDRARRPLKVKRMDERDIVLSLPRHGPDTINTVIALKIKGPVRTDSVRLLSAVLTNRLLAFDGDRHGKGLRYGDGKATRYYVYGWDKPGQWVSWHVRLNGPADYRLYMKYETDADNGGSAYRIDVGKKTIRGKVKVPSHRSHIFTEDLGTVRLAAGEQQISLKADSIRGDELMKLFEIDLVPAGAAR
jgi:alpha-L-fucosidase